MTQQGGQLVLPHTQELADRLAKENCMLREEMKKAYGHKAPRCVHPKLSPKNLARIQLLQVIRLVVPTYTKHTHIVFVPLSFPCKPCLQTDILSPLEECV